jgi:hypothetical protein
MMKMAITIVITLLLTKAYSQKPKYLTKDEVLRYWNLPSHKKQKDTRIVNSGSALNRQLIKFVDSLQLNNLDSVIIFSTAYPGYSSVSKCDTGMFPVTTFIIWNKHGETFIRKMRGACSSGVSKSTLMHLFSFYAGSRAKLKSESFMPVIFNAYINKDKTLTYTETGVDHEPNYSFFYKIGKDSRSFHFCESFLEDKQSIFHDYNLSLKVYAWWMIVKKELDKLDQVAIFLKQGATEK